MTTKQRVLYKIYKFSSYVFNKTRALTVAFIELAWRFLELYLHKIIVLTLFATAISQVSVLYWFLLLLVVVFVVPIPYINPLTYPLLTLYLGVVTVAKMVYQFPVISDEEINFPSSGEQNCMDKEVRRRERGGGGHSCPGLPSTSLVHPMSLVDTWDIP